MGEKQIEKVALVARSAEQRSARALKDTQVSHQQNCDQLEQLIAFKREYEDKLEAKGDQGIDARQLQDYRLFLAKLGQAIDQQMAKVETSSGELDAIRDQWLSNTHHRSSLDKLQSQRRTSRRQAREKVEQKESDERSMLARSSRTD